MRRKILIFNLLFALALLPVAQAMMPVSAPMDSTHEMPMDGGHDMTMHCNPGDHGGCLDIDCCSGGHHANCDTHAKATPAVIRLADRSSGSTFAEDVPVSFFSHPVDRLLRPPRNA